jgi:hypothetical protein
MTEKIIPSKKDVEVALNTLFEWVNSEETDEHQLADVIMAFVRIKEKKELEAKLKLGIQDWNGWKKTYTKLIVDKEIPKDFTK